jgi:hypothetical protein
MRRLRGILGAAIIWAIAWIPIGVAFGVRRWLLTPWGDFLVEGAIPQRPALFPIIANTVLIFLIWGALVGIVFAIALLSAERRRTIQGLSGIRLGLWGALSAVVPPIAILVTEAARSRPVFIDWSFILILLITAAWGAGCAAGMLRIARGQTLDVAA